MAGRPAQSRPVGLVGQVQPGPVVDGLAEFAEKNINLRFFMFSFVGNGVFKKLHVSFVWSKRWCFFLEWLEHGVRLELGSPGRRLASSHLWRRRPTNDWPSPHPAAPGGHGSVSSGFGWSVSLLDVGAVPRV